MKRSMASVAFVGALMAGTTLAATALRADNIETLGNMRPTGASQAMPLVPQTGAEADAIKKTLTQIKLPDGFHIALYALVPDARQIAVGPQGIAIIVGTKKSKIWSVTDRGHTGTGGEVKEYAPTIAKTIPNAVCFSKDGFLYSVEQNRILTYPAAEFYFENADVPVGVVVPQGELIPKDAESYNHTARYCKIGPDKMLYVGIGEPYNVPPPDRLAEFTKAGVGSIIRMDGKGKNREIYASGVRNSVGLAFDPSDKTLWFTDNQVDGMGDDMPPGELNHATKAGQNFGFPWYGGGHVRTAEYKDQTPPAGVVFPVVEEQAHAADLGMTVYSGRLFPAKYKGAIFSAQHGSWNRTEPDGARVMVTFPGKTKSEPFAEGWLDQDGSYLGRPVDVAQMRDGSLLVSDDQAGALYRITYDGK